MTTPPQRTAEGLALEELRLDRDWTYKQLAEAIADSTQHRRDADCWRRICLGLTPRPHRRTLDILGKFLKAVPKARRRKVA